MPWEGCGPVVMMLVIRSLRARELTRILKMTTVSLLFPLDLCLALRVSLEDSLLIMGDAKMLLSFLVTDSYMTHVLFLCAVP